MLEDFDYSEIILEQVETTTTKNGSKVVKIQFVPKKKKVKCKWCKTYIKICDYNKSFRNFIEHISLEKDVKEH